MTVAGVDKFGNVFTLRLPDNASEDSVGNTSRLLWEQGLLNGAPNKLDNLCNYFLGEVATSITKCALKSQGKEVLLVSTITGGIYAFSPFLIREELNFFTHLEMFMRQEYQSLCQRDHLSYRSFFTPVKSVIDGDLCEKFLSLPFSKQKEFAVDIDRQPQEIIKKLEEMREFI